MNPTDIADVTGATYTYLLNGTAPNGWTGLFKPGERVRLRFINGSSQSYFDVRIPGLKMTVVAADGLAEAADEDTSGAPGAGRTGLVLNAQVPMTTRVGKGLVIAFVLVGVAAVAGVIAFFPCGTMDVTKLSCCGA